MCISRRPGWAAFFAAAALCVPAIGQTFTLEGASIDGGGGRSAGGPFDLLSTIGQHDSGTEMSGGGFELSGGFLPGGAPPLCPGDVDGDRDVDLTDLTVLLSSFGTTSGATREDGDLDDDGDVDLTDLTLMLSSFGTWCD